MTSISSDLSTITGANPTPVEQADESLVGTPKAVSSYESAKQYADAALVDLTSPDTSGVASDLATNVPPSLTAASALVSTLAQQISQSGTQATTAYSLLSAQSALKLTRA
ncbi:MAG: hypothetical protein ACP5H2_02665 [Solirubrobacteraceae bacterium]